MAGFVASVANLLVFFSIQAGFGTVAGDVARFAAVVARSIVVRFNDVLIAIARDMARLLALVAGLCVWTFAFALQMAHLPAVVAGTAFDFILAIFGQVSRLIASVASLRYLFAVPGKVAVLVAAVAASDRAVAAAAEVGSRLAGRVVIPAIVVRAAVVAFARKMARLSTFIANIVTHSFVFFFLFFR